MHKRQTCRHQVPAWCASGLGRALGGLPTLDLRVTAVGGLQRDVSSNSSTVWAALAFYRRLRSRSTASDASAAEDGGQRCMHEDDDDAQVVALGSSDEEGDDESKEDLEQCHATPACAPASGGRRRCTRGSNLLRRRRRRRAEEFERPTEENMSSPTEENMSIMKKRACDSTSRGPDPRLWLANGRRSVVGFVVGGQCVSCRSSLACGTRASWCCPVPAGSCGYRQLVRRRGRSLFSWNRCREQNRS